MSELSKTEILESHNIVELDLEDLVAFSGDTPFKPYKDKQLDSLVEDIKQNGIIVPIIVRPKKPHLNDGVQKYEILSGNNRVTAGELAGIKTFKAIVRDDLGNDDDAKLIIIRANLYQRSFKALPPSEQAKVIYEYHRLIKKQGRRTDLIHGVEMLDKMDLTSRQHGEKIEADELTGGEFEVSARTISRLLRIHELNDYLKECLDDGKFKLDPAINISYLKKEEQQELEELLGDNADYKINMKKGKELREASKTGKLTKEKMEEILKGNVESSQKFKTIKMDINTFEQLFPKNLEPEAVAKKIEGYVKLFKEILVDAINEYDSLENPEREDMESFINGIKNIVSMYCKDIKIEENLSTLTDETTNNSPDIIDDSKQLVEKPVSFIPTPAVKKNEDEMIEFDTDFIQELEQQKMMNRERKNDYDGKEATA